MDTPAPRRRFDLVAYLKLFRFPLVFTAIADSAAGYLILRPHLYEGWVLALLAITSAGLYLFGMALNDIADLDRDRQIAPTRVLPSGRLALGQARSAALLMLAFSFEGMIWLGMVGHGPQMVFPWVFAVLCICAYDFGWVKVPPVMGLVRLSNFMIGVSAGQEIGYGWHGQPPWIFGPLGMPIFIYVTGLTYVSTLEDREGRQPKVWIGAGTMAFAAVIASSLRNSSWGSGSPTVVGMFLDSFAPAKSIGALLVSATLASWILFRASRARDRKGIMLLVRDGIAGIILLDAALLISSSDQFLLGAILALLLVPAAVSVAIFKKLA